MKVTIFGATGGTGRHLVQQACEAGHEVTAVVRDPARIGYRSPQLTVVTADAMDPVAIGPAVAGRDVVVSAIGSRDGRAPTTVHTDSSTSIIEAMRGAGTRRLIVVSNS